MTNKQIFWKTLKYFVSWRAILFLVAFLSTLLIANFGNRFPYADRVLSVTHLPNWVWGFGNFDGVHYLRIAQNGYTAEYTQAFFPIYPLLIRFLNFIPKTLGLDLSIYTDPSYFVTAMILSVAFFVPALYFLFKLWGKEYDLKTATLSLLLLLSFPTAFYFGAIYSEALFLLLTVLTFWFTKKDNLALAGVFAALASATKIQGVLLFLFLVIELWNKYKKVKMGRRFWLDLLGVIISPLGLLTYMLFLQKSVGDPLYFLTSQPNFGTGKSSLPIILLPQVIYRYIKIFLTVNPLSLTFLNALLEFLFTSALVVGLIIAFKKIKFSYWVFICLVVIVPTLTGTFSSMPRYVLLAFPIIPFIALRFNKASKYIIIAQAIVQVVLLSLFIRGYWVA